MLLKKDADRLVEALVRLMQAVIKDAAARDLEYYQDMRHRMEDLSAVLQKTFFGR